MATVTPITEVRALLDAVDADAAAAAAAALLDGETLLVQGVGLANTGAVALDPGDSERVLGLNAKNQLVLHTGDDNGDDLPHMLSSEQVIQISGNIAGSALSGQLAYTRVLARFKLPAADAVVGRRISLSGNFWVSYFGAGRPDEALQLVFHPEETAKTTAIAVGPWVNLGTPTTKELFHFTLDFILNAGSAGKFTLAADTSGLGGFQQKDSAGTITHDDFAVVGNSTGTLAVDQDILITLYSRDSEGGPSDFQVGGMISAKIYTP